MKKQLFEQICFLKSGKEKAGINQRVFSPFVPQSIDNFLLIDQQLKLGSSLILSDNEKTLESYSVLDLSCRPFFFGKNYLECVNVERRKNSLIFFLNLLLAFLGANTDSSEVHKIVLQLKI